MEHSDISVRTYGSGSRVVVLLHGGPGAPGYMAPLARALAADFRILEPLQRPAGDVPLSVAQHVADLAAVAPERAVLVGSSWGAMLALSYASVHPSRVRALVLIGCGTYDTDSRAAYRRAMDTRLGQGGLAEIEALKAKLNATIDMEEREGLFDAIGDLSTRIQCHDPLTTEFEVVRSDARGHEETWNDAMRQQERGIEPAAFAAIEGRVLMLHGAEDPHPGRPTRDTLRAHVPQLEYVEFERCGHLPWVERHAREPFLELLRARLLKMTQ